jgi:thiol:disulfide interchange protein
LTGHLIWTVRNRGKAIGPKAITISWLAFVGAIALSYWKPSNAKSQWFEYVLIFLTLASALLVTFGPYFLQRHLKMTPDFQKELCDKKDSERIDYLMEKGLSKKDAEIMLQHYKKNLDR